MHSVPGSGPSISPEKPDFALRRRRYVVYLFSPHDETNDTCGTPARIQPGLLA